MTSDERKACREWIISTVTADDVPHDEGNSEALVYNLVHLLMDGREYRRYNYEPDQDAELRSWGLEV